MNSLEFITNRFRSCAVEKMCILFDLYSPRRTFDQQHMLLDACNEKEFIEK